MAAITTGAGPGTIQSNPANNTDSVVDIFEKMSYGPAPEAENVAQVKKKWWRRFFLLSMKDQ